MSHESYARSDAVEGSSDRSFGMVFAVVFAVLALAPWILAGKLVWWPLPISAGFLLAGLLRPHSLAPLNRWWLKFGLLLHRVVSPVALGLMFFVVITPFGFLARLWGWNPLKLGFDKALGSYWVYREPPGPTPESMKDQF